MRVTQAAQGMVVYPNQIYVIPPNANMAFAKGMLWVTPRSQTSGPYLPIDHLFRSLADYQRERAIGVVLSGNGSDGALGLCEIKAAGGITFAQDVDSASHPGMPRSAIDSGCVDLVSSPETIAQRLVKIGGHSHLASVESVNAVAKDENNFARILAAVRVATGVDFSHSHATIQRRISRRMALRDQESLADYAQLLEAEKSETDALYRDLSMDTTSFFRDAAMFDALKRSVLPKLTQSMAPNTALRVWAPGCSTGQEAYSLAITLMEFFDTEPVRPVVQIFATDVSDVSALEHARNACYPLSIEADVSPERLRRFFKKEDQCYRIVDAVRELCVFARHNVTADPPYSRIDLISCRNVLLFLAPPLQKRVLSSFHFSLNAVGFLVLGSSESMDEPGALFDVINEENKIYAKKATVATPPLHSMIDNIKAGTPLGQLAGVPGASPADFQTAADRLLLHRYTPPGVLVDSNFDIVQFRGRSSDYLAPPPGEPTMSVLKMVREGLAADLSDALQKAATHQVAVRREGVRMQGAQGVREIDLQVLPLQGPMGGATSRFLVLFEEPKSANSSKGNGSTVVGDTLINEAAPSSTGFRHWVRNKLGPPDAERELVGMRLELTETKVYMQSLVDQQGDVNEELRSANQESESRNEELISINEQLENAKEALLHSNEGLASVNEQLESRNLELSRTTNDLNNLLTSTTIPLFMVGDDLCIRLLTVAAQQVINMLPTDVGRPIGDLKVSVDVPDLEALIKRVIDQDEMQEREIQDRAGHWYTLRIYPYRTANNEIDGAVVALLDIDEVKRTQKTLQQNAEQLNFQATHDLLTGLVNRGEFERRLYRVLGADSGPHAVLYLDLDQFKIVNDSCGHLAGDALLRQLGSMLEARMRKRDTLARLGGDEFGILLEHCPTRQALLIAEGLVRAVQDFHFLWQGRSFFVGVSIGLAPIEHTGETLQNVLKTADLACYAAKERGRNRVHIYTPSDEELVRRQGEMQWMPRIQQAFEQGRFRLYVQPVIALQENSGDVEYQEILLRLLNEENEVMLPGAFIPAVERYQQMQVLDRWVIRTALSTIYAQRSEGRYAINVSGQSLGDERFLDFVMEQFDEIDVKPARVCFEITETAAIADFKNAMHFMVALKERGCRFALDDFGIGLSSFNYLKTLPVEYLKIDGRFIKGIADDPIDDALVQSIHRVGHVMGIKTIAESVETQAALDRLKAIHVDYAQGRVIAPPHPF